MYSTEFTKAHIELLDALREFLRVVQKEMREAGERHPFRWPLIAHCSRLAAAMGRHELGVEPPR